MQERVEQINGNLSLLVKRDNYLRLLGKWRVPVINGAPQPISFKIYQGEGITGTLLASSLNLYTPSYNDSNGNYISGEYVYFDITSDNISVASGSKYTIRLTLTDGKSKCWIFRPKFSEFLFWWSWK